MINKISIGNVATYKENFEIIPTKINFVYGNNGTGKSTLAKIINKEIVSDSCRVENTNSDSIYTYNRKFVEDNFENRLPGIFTLGSNSKTIKNEIDEIKRNIDNLQDRLKKLSTSSERNDSEIEELKKEYSNKIWDSQKNTRDIFKDALTGCRGSKKEFFEKCINVKKVEDKTPIIKYEELKREYDSIYSNNLTALTNIEKIDVESLKLLEADGKITEKIITGKTDTPFGTFIDFLSANDWVKEGTKYLPKTNGKCPFCQQALAGNLLKDLENYFDENYSKSCKMIELFKEKYFDYLDKLANKLSHIEDNIIYSTEFSLLTKENEIINTIISNNRLKVENKIKSPSTPIQVDSLIENIEHINQLIDEINKNIDKNNEILNNKQKAKIEFASELWLYIVDLEVRNLTEYETKINALEKAKAGIDKTISDAKEELLNNENLVREKEKTITSIVPTINDINDILRNFDYNGFYIAENPDDIGTYKICRKNGSDAKKTLSEGEYNFISFLYFYFMCFGSIDGSNVIKDKIIVIDDPVSSLDSNVLFIVTTLIKNLINECRNDKNGIKQVFIMTHNIYFFKEITFIGNKNKYKKDEVRYFQIRKNKEESKIENYSENPIKTTYQLLWDDIKNPTINSSRSVFNSMRRILEYYFNTIGNIDYERVINEFDGSEKIICKALISFFNDGSHTVFDDESIMIDDSSISNYLSVFEKIFSVLNQSEHYNMMMNKEKEMENNNARN